MTITADWVASPADSDDSPLLPPRATHARPTPEQIRQHIPLAIRLPHDTVRHRGALSQEQVARPWLIDSQILQHEGIDARRAT